MSKKVQTDPAFETAVDAYIDEVLKSEKEHYQSDLQPFEVHARKVKDEISKKMHDFYTAYNHGYKVIADEMGKDNAISINQEMQIEDPLEFMQKLSEGKALYELLGLSLDTVLRFYDAACAILEKHHYKDAKDAFYFLVTIAPTIGEAWLGLSHAYIHCKEHESAIASARVTVDLLPEKAESYLVCARAYIEMQDFEEAKAVCHEGLQHAEKHRTEPWAEELGSMMQEAKRQIDDLFQKSQYQSFSS